MEASSHEWINMTEWIWPNFVNMTEKLTTTNLNIKTWPKNVVVQDWYQSVPVRSTLTPDPYPHSNGGQTLGTHRSCPPCRYINYNYNTWPSLTVFSLNIKSVKVVLMLKNVQLMPFSFSLWVTASSFCLTFVVNIFVEITKNLQMLFRGENSNNVFAILWVKFNRRL